jgi:hypothetical protein
LIDAACSLARHRFGARQPLTARLHSEELGFIQKKWCVRPHDEPTIAQFAGL